MKRQWIKTAAIIICMLAAGICYSCGKGEELTIDSSGKAEITETPTGEALSLAEDKTAAPENMEGSAPAVYHYVHICGEVMSPGVYQMAAGSRIYEAVEAAGGFTNRAASEYLNLAQTVEDGMKLVVPSVDEIELSELRGPSEAGGSGEGSGVGSAKVNLNTATKEQLMTLKGIGEAKAEDIIQYREEHGKFQSIEDIMKIPGIKDAAFQKMKEDITV